MDSPIAQPLHEVTSPPPRGFKEAASEFVSARLKLIALEAQSAGKAVMRKVVCAVVAILCALFIWLGSMVGLIGWVTSLTGLPWFGVTFLAVLVHLLVAGVCVWMMTRAGSPYFPHTCNELSKDREWLKTLKKPSKD